MKITPLLSRQACRKLSNKGSMTVINYTYFNLIKLVSSHLFWMHSWTRIIQAKRFYSSKFRFKLIKIYVFLAFAFYLLLFMFKFWIFFCWVLLTFNVYHSPIRLFKRGILRPGRDTLSHCAMWVGCTAKERYVCIFLSSLLLFFIIIIIIIIIIINYYYYYYYVIIIIIIIIAIAGRLWWPRLS